MSGRTGANGSQGGPTEQPSLTHPQDAVALTRRFHQASTMAMLKPPVIRSSWACLSDFSGPWNLQMDCLGQLLENLESCCWIEPLSKSWSHHSWVAILPKPQFNTLAPKDLCMPKFKNNENLVSKTDIRTTTFGRTNAQHEVRHECSIVSGCIQNRRIVCKTQDVPARISRSTYITV